MKLTPMIHLLALALVLTLAATGCRKNPYGVTPLPGNRPQPVRDDGLRALEGGRVQPGEGIRETDFSQAALPDFGDIDNNFHHDRATLAANTVYFDFDSYAVKAGERSKLEGVASYLNANPGKALLVEGHCDERGTEEYNRSLGERRALAVREQLAIMGADASRIVTRSWGEDRPADPGRTEAAYAKNRRGEFVVLTPK